ncbi:MAG: RNA methyltransferase, partial [Clostridiales bacterium]|nr:RNA methyltransferase [Clostridiales bacterium]
MIRPITSPHNPLFARLRQISLRKDRLNAFFLAEGVRLAEEALKSGCVRELVVRTPLSSPVKALLDTAEDSLPVWAVEEAAFRRIAETVTPQGVLAVCSTGDIAFPAPAYPELSVALNGVQDPGNVGTIIRTMDAAGLGTLYIDQTTADPFSSKVIRSTMGGIFRVPVRLENSLSETLIRLHEGGSLIIGGALNGSDLFSRPPCGKKACIVIGNEGHGIEESILPLLDAKLRIPMPGGAESLNAAVSAGILIYD